MSGQTRGSIGFKMRVKGAMLEDRRWDWFLAFWRCGEYSPKVGRNVDRSRMGGEEGVQVSLLDVARYARDCSNATSNCTRIKLLRYMDCTMIHACGHVGRVSFRKDGKH